MPDLMLLIVGLGVIGTEVGVLGLLWTARLDTEVRESGLYYRFFPFQRTQRRVSGQEIERAEARTYSPIREFGGWGIRLGTSGKAYTVSGSEGVQVHLLDGSSFLIGSQRGQELAEALRLCRR